MNEKKETQPEKQQGIDIDKITFGEDGESTGLDDDVLDSVSGGLMNAEDNVNCPCSTNNC